jgi:hypothetical protein
MIEWDAEIPAYSALEAELRKAEAVQQKIQENILADETGSQSSSLTRETRAPAAQAHAKRPTGAGDCS